MDEKEKKTFSYIAVQRNDTEKIPKGTRVTFESEREVETSTGLMFRKEIAQACPDISVTTIERTLAELLTSGQIKKVGSGRSTAYVKS